MTLVLPEGFSAGAADPEDIEGIAEAFEAYESSLGVPHQPYREFLTWVFSLAYVDLTRDTLLIRRGDEICGYAHALRDPGEGGPLHAGGFVRPDAWDRGLGSAMLRWYDTMLAVHGAERVRTGVVAQDQRGHHLMFARSYELVRTSWDMERSLVGYRTAVPTPAGVTIRPFRSGRDEATLHEVAASAFVDHWEHQRRSLESFTAEYFDAADWDPGLCYLAELDGRAVGEVIALAFTDRGYIASVGVLREARGRGIAKMLLRRAFTVLADRGFERVELSVDASSPTGAVDLYEGLGMHVIRETSTFFGRTA